jgi:hypothetical protein
MEMVPRDHKPDEELLESLQMAAKKVRVGAVYAHYKNPDLLYKIVCHVILEASDEPAVLYQGQYGKNITYARALSIWLESVPWQDKMVPRFTKVQD